MTQDPIESARIALLARRKALLAQWSQELADEQELLSSREIDWEDIAAQQRDAGLVARIAEANVSELREVVAALERVHHGTYGNCAHCSEQIAWPRLKALPWARFCEDCAELIEEEKKKTGGVGA